MTHIQLPHLIKEKINDYLSLLSFTKWRDKMSRVCIEYHQTYVYFEFSMTEALNRKKDFLKNYNYRNLYRDRDLLYNDNNDYVMNSSFQPICKLSPNY
ncbi:MAG: hypothetical protein WD512_12410 [Candidatus Paceibacterota bacterium]